MAKCHQLTSLAESRLKG